MRVPGVKYFRLLNIGRLFLGGVEVTATAEEINNAAAPAAENVPIEDENGRYTSENVEDALQEIAGFGRTNETVKSAYDLADDKYELPAEGIPASDLHDDVQTILGNVDDKYELPAEGIPASDLHAGVQASLGKADTAMQGAPDITSVRAGKVTLNGIGPTPVVFGASTKASVNGTEEETFDLSANDKTLIVTPDGEAEETITFDGGVAGTSESGAGPSEDISSQADHKFKVSVDGADPEEVSLGALGGLSTGAAIATAIQNAINGIDGVSGVVCTWDDGSSGTYLITSGTLGTGSSIVITRADDHNVTEELKLGVSDGGSESPGEGDFANYAEATAAEVVAKINAGAVHFEAVVVDDTKIGIRGLADGGSLVVGAGTTNTIFGITADTYLGAVGLGYATDMENDAYFVSATLNGTSQVSIADKGLSINNRSASGFSIECETEAADDDVDVVIFGVAAAPA